MRLKDGLCRLKRREETLQEFLHHARLTGEVFEDVFSASLLGALVHFERAFKPRNSAADSDGRWGCHFSAGVSPHLCPAHRPCSSSDQVPEQECRARRAGCLCQLHDDDGDDILVDDDDASADLPGTHLPTGITISTTLSSGESF